MLGRTRFIVTVLALACSLALAPGARAMAVQDLATLRGTGETTLWGLGFVVGLQGTGDTGDFLPMARQLAQLLERGGNVVPDVRELADAQNIAMVMVTCTVPREGARQGEKLDVEVQAWHNADSLAGGRLFITPMQGPLPGQGVYAFADGPLNLDAGTETAARVRGGARISRDIRMSVIDGAGDLHLQVNPAYAGWTTTKLIANTINQDRQGFRAATSEIASAVDSKTVRVRIPEAELANPANFIGAVLSIRLDPSLLDLPARVVVNERTGSIVVTGDVRISPSVISHRDLVVTTVTPPVEPTAENREVSRTDVTAVGEAGTSRQTARLEDLLEAMKALDVPVEDRIQILAQMHRAGRLHAEFIVE